MELRSSRATYECKRQMVSISFKDQCVIFFFLLVCSCKNLPTFMYGLGLSEEKKVFGIS
jgi:hypothetical protein